MKVEQAAQKLGEMILLDRYNPEVIAFAYRAMAASVFSGSLLQNLLVMVSNSVKYTREPEGRDVWQTAEETLRLTKGDCEDMAILLCSAALAANVKTGFKIVALEDTYNHIYPILYDSKTGEWLAADPTPDVPKLGKEAPAVKRVTYTVNGGITRISQEEIYGPAYPWWVLPVAFVVFLLVAFKLLGKNEEYK